jgi:hypothetical protein
VLNTHREEENELHVNRLIRPFYANSAAHGFSRALSARRHAVFSPRGPAKQTRRQFVTGMLAMAAPATADEPMRWQIDCFTRPWAAHDHRVALDSIAAAGFKYVGLMTAKSKDNLIISVATTPDEAAAAGVEVKRRGDRHECVGLSRAEGRRAYSGHRQGGFCEGARQVEAGRLHAWSTGRGTLGSR